MLLLLYISFVFLRMLEIFHSFLHVVVISSLLTFGELSFLIC